ncbi:MAG TPA: FAD-binding protein, partial [Helicobacteraceae bacterium]|nr:FAD-binding protein [Helicobacteraceae bacterium]
MIDVLVIGSGGAGLVAALRSVEMGATVKVVSKSLPTRSQTSMAQGGINAALGNHGEDSVQLHYEDTLKSAQGLGDANMIRMMSESAIEAIAWLDRIGVPFSRTAEGKIAQRRLGGASAARACYSQDYTGLKILHTLYDACNKADVAFVNERFLLDFVCTEGSVTGATFLNLKTGEVELIEAKSVIVATGGYSRVYHKHSTNASGSTGDGIAAALRAGAKLSDLEFVQFHPTGLKNSSILISESARGAGGHLLNAKHERFTNELAPRDVLAAAIYDEIEHGSGAVYLDIRHLGEAFIDEELPQERKLARLYEGIDPVHELIPIKPVAHYTMGGIDVDATTQSSIKGLYAIGECANQKVHGANRLGGNSLLELIVFGKISAQEASEFAKNRTDVAFDTQQFEKDKKYIEAIKNYEKRIDFYEKHHMMADVFYKDAGISRDKVSVAAALEMVQELQNNIPLMGPKDSSKVYNTNLVEFLEFTNMLALSEVMLQGALARNESRGAHSRRDIPEKNDTDYGGHTI